MPVREFAVVISGNAAPFIASSAEAEAAGSKLESTVNRTGGSFQTMGSKGSAAVEQTKGHVGLLEGGVNRVDGAIKGVLGSLGSMVGQAAGIGALFGTGALLAGGVKAAEDYNKQLGILKAAANDAGIAMNSLPVDQISAKMRTLGISDQSTLTALTTLTAAHIPASEQMATLSTAADLAAEKHIDLASATDVVLKATQGMSRGLMDLGIQGVAVVPKVVALNNATAAVSKAQKTYNDDLSKYGTNSAKTIAAHNALATAQQKVATITAEQANRFGSLNDILGQINQHVSGAAAAAAGADPLQVMGAQLTHIAQVGGQQLIPMLDEWVAWIDGHQGQIGSFVKTAFTDFGIAVKDVGGFVAHDLMPPLLTVGGWVIDHKQAFIDIGLALGALYVERKAVSAGKTIFSDVKGLLSDLQSASGLVSKVLGLGGSGGGVTGGAGTGALGIQHVWVDNMVEGGLGGGGAGSAVGAATGAAEGAGGAAVVGGLEGAGAGSILGGAAAGIGASVAIVAAVPLLVVAAEAISTTARNAMTLAGHTKTMSDAFQALSGDVKSGLATFSGGYHIAQEALVNAGLHGGNIAVATQEIEGLVRQHKITNATQLAQIIGYWNTTQSSTGAVSLTTAQMEASLARSAAVAGAAAAIGAGLPPAEQALLQATWAAANSAQAVAAANAAASAVTYGGKKTGGVHSFAAGGVITEPVMGIGQRTGQTYSFAEAGTEFYGSPARGGMSPTGVSAGVPSGGGGGMNVSIGSLVLQGVQDPQALFDQLRKIGINQRGRGQGVGQLWPR